MEFYDSEVGIVNRLQARKTGVQIPVGARPISFLQNVQTGFEAYPGLLLKGYQGSSAGIKAAGT